MRATPVFLSCCTMLIGLAVADEVRADAVKVTPELTVFTDEQTRPADGKPTVLRGSAIRRGTADRRGGVYHPSRFQWDAGDKLWLTDPVSGRVIVCDERRTSRVGSRFVGCLEDSLPYALYE